MIKHAWDADIGVTLDLAARLIARQFPQFAAQPVEAFGMGWDNAAFLVNGEVVFRFPRRQVAVALLETETHCLPRLAEHLPLPVPNARYVGKADAEYPYPFLGYTLLHGTTACRLTWTGAERVRCAAPLGRFLRALHAVPVDAAARAVAPGDTLNRANVAMRADALRERLTRLAPLIPVSGLAELNTMVSVLAETPLYDGTPRWVHGDLYPRHLLVDSERSLCGIIDWGDVHLGDPAIDLSIAFSFLPPSGRDAFQDAYGAIGAATWDRARFRALHYGAILTLYGADVGDTAIQMAGMYALENAVVP